MFRFHLDFPVITSKLFIAYLGRKMYFVLNYIMFQSAGLV